MRQSFLWPCCVIKMEIDKHVIDWAAYIFGPRNV